MTGWIQDRANELLRGGNAGVKRVPFATAIKAATTHAGGLRPALRRRPARTSSTWTRSAPPASKLGVDPLGGAAVPYWEPINAVYGLDIAVVNPAVDPTFSFMTVDHDGKIRMDCSSPYAMARLVGAEGPVPRRLRQRPRRGPARHRHAVGGADEPEPLPGGGHPLPARRTARSGRRTPAVGKTLVSSSMIDRVVQQLGRRLCEVPVGFKWFVPGLFDGSCCFGGEESAGASFLRRDGTVWTTDKDGLIMDLLAAEITARTGKDPGRALPRADRGVRHAVLHAHRRAGDARAEGAAAEALARGGDGSERWPASRSPPS